MTSPASWTRRSPTTDIGQTYELAGPRLITLDDAIAEIANVIGGGSATPRSRRRSTRPPWPEQAVPAEFVELLLYQFSAVLDGRNASLINGVQHAVRREPRNFADYRKPPPSASGVASVAICPGRRGPFHKVNPRRWRMHMQKLVQGATLVTATIAMGLMAGVFGLYAHAIMPGLRQTDDRTFVGAFQSIDKAIINPWFMPTFVGALVLTGLAAVLHLRGDGREVLPWVAAALALYLVVFVITVAVNVPLNDEIKAAGDPHRIADLAAVRERFDEDRWARWNIVRAVASTAALGCLAWALVQYGRTLLQSEA